MGKIKKKSHPKKRTAAFKEKEAAELIEAPHSFIIHRGLSCPYITDLTHDFRKIMEPFTAGNLKERKINRIKDFVSMSGFFHVSHMGIFNKAATQLSFKIVRMPRGPTLTFKVHQFTLARDVLSMNKRQFIDADLFKNSPLVVMNNFTGDGRHLKLMANTFQNMFPAISLSQINVSTVRRCVLFSYNSQTNLVEMRHYSIQVVPVGLTKGVKKLILGKIPNLGKWSDISDYIMCEGAVKESEVDEEENNEVILPQTLKNRGNIENNKSAVHLYEIGPRLTMQLMKIEDGLHTGEVLYHDHIVKTEKEKEDLRIMIEKKKKQKEFRRKQQAENVYHKKHNKASYEDTDPDDDAKYFKTEVGEDADEELFKNATKHLKRSHSQGTIKYGIKKKRNGNK